MSLKPIDVQLMYSNLSNVGKELGELKNASVVANEADRQKLVNDSLAKGHKVEKPNGPDNGVINISDDDPAQNFQQQHNNKPKEDNIDDESVIEELHDPSIGNIVDISG